MAAGEEEKRHISRMELHSILTCIENPMAATHKIHLTPEQIRFLSKLPEQGMGYQIVDVDLRGGNTLFERVVLNSEYLRLDDDEVIDPSEIVSIHLHQRQRPSLGESRYPLTA